MSWGLMKNKIQLLFILLTIIIFSFPSICFSESKTVEGNHCEIYLGDMKNKDDLEKFRKSVGTESIRNGLTHLMGLHPTSGFEIHIKYECLDRIISQYLEKVVVVSHTEEGRHMCDKVKITFDPEVVDKYLSQENCILPNSWFEDIDFVLKKKTDKINIGLIVETKIPDVEGSKREQLENEEEEEFFYMMRSGTSQDKYKVIDRRYLSKVLEEQKLSSSGITDNETVKLGKILNLDIIVLRMRWSGFFRQPGAGYKW